MEAGYNRLIELDPENEKRYLEKKREVVDIAVASHALLLPAIAHCQKPIRANRVTHEDRDPQVKIREGLRPDRLKMDFTPVEFRKWKASNVQHANTHRHIREGSQQQQDKVRHIQGIPSKKS